MRKEGIVGRKKKRFRKTTDSNHTDPIAPNVLARNFDAALPDTAWFTEVTYVFTHQGWLYWAVILDLFSRRVVGWTASANNDRTLALDALGKAVTLRDPASGLIHHSDRGSVYASGDYRDALDELGAIKSMSRKGDCWDNSVAESFFATIKGEMIDHEDYQTRAEAVAAVADYIDSFYNVTRLHSAIGYVSPIEFELKFRIDKQAA
jgi:putative transposase